MRSSFRLTSVLAMAFLMVAWTMLPATGVDQTDSADAGGVTTILHTYYNTRTTCLGQTEFQITGIGVKFTRVNFQRIVTSAKTGMRVFGATCNNGNNATNSTFKYTFTKPAFGSILKVPNLPIYPYTAAWSGPCSSASFTCTAFTWAHTFIQVFPPPAGYTTNSCAAVHVYGAFDAVCVT